MIRSFISFAAVAALGLSLAACGEDKTAETETPKKAVEKTQPAPKADSKDMTPAEAVDNMKRDAGIVADKAKEGYDAAKEAVTDAYKKAKSSIQEEPTETKQDTSGKMTPGEALDNMQRDAGKVADKAKEGYNAAKEAVTKALSE